MVPFFQRMASAGLIVLIVPVAAAWAAGGTVGAIVAGIDRSWTDVAMSVAIPGYGAYYTIKHFFLSPEPPTMEDRASRFISLVDAGPVYDHDCVEYGGVPVTNPQHLETAEPSTMVVNGEEFPIVRKDGAFYVLYGWPIEDPPHIAIGVCEFSDE